MRMIDNVIAKNKEVGGTFFDNKTVLYFKSTVLPTLYGNGKYFVSYDIDDNGDKVYMIREVLDSGLIRRANGGETYTTKADAVSAIRDLIDGAVTA